MIRKVVLFLGLMTAVPGPVRAQALDSLPERPTATPISSQPTSSCGTWRRPWAAYRR